MSDPYWLTDEQMARLEPYFPKSHGKPGVDHRRLFSSIVPQRTALVRCTQGIWLPRRGSRRCRHLLAMNNVSGMAGLGREADRPLTKDR